MFFFWQVQFEKLHFFFLVPEKIKRKIYFLQFEWSQHYKKKMNRQQHKVKKKKKVTSL